MEKGVLVQYGVALSVSLITVTMGVTSGWATPIATKLKANQTSIDITEDQLGWVFGMPPIGFTIGSLVTGFFPDQIGRKKTLLSTAAPFFCGMVLAITAKQGWMLCIMTLLWGFGTGMASTVLMTYIAEIADKSLRATLSVITRVGFNLGTFLMMLCGPFILYETLNYTIFALPIFIFFGCLWIPESPYYFLKEGHVQRARRELIKLRNNPEVVEAELETIKAGVNKDMQRSSTPKELFTGPQYRKAIIIAAGLKVAQILTGALAIQQYLGTIIGESKSDIKPSTAMVIFGAVKFVVSITSTVLADRVGRRPLLVYSFFGNGISLASVGTYFSLQNVVHVNDNILKIFGFIPLTGIVVSNVVSTLGFNSIIGIIQAEIFPLNVRNVAMVSLNIFGGFLGFSVSKGFQMVKNSFGISSAFWTFTVISILSALFSYFFVPETKGKSLEEIQCILAGKVSSEISEVNVDLVQPKDVEMKELVNGEELDKPKS
ncbi:facilitated trehalose transporter Tret1-like [Aricia agestis]|uniref:facilitated trehalose transporter Tret1-like n=1 Tax=Aricia agestis TaxID=91739 RepID=UPI001C20B12A|nr:facilitated trehalose transporter Tret1-like [Aricia agestis]